MTELDIEFISRLRLRGYRLNEIAEQLFVTVHLLQRWRLERERVNFIDPLNHIVGEQILDRLAGIGLF